MDMISQENIIEAEIQVEMQAQVQADKEQENDGENDGEEEINEKLLFELLANNELRRRDYDLEMKMFELTSRENVLLLMQNEIEVREDKLLENLGKLRKDKRKVSKDMQHANYIRKRAEDAEMVALEIRQEASDNLQIVNEQLRSMIYHTQEVLETTTDEEANEDEASCTVCFTNKLRIAPGCGHLCMCRECAAHIHSKGGRKCPICRQSWNTLTKIIIS
jgi:hypothetical protein